MIGTILGSRYELIKKIGEGGMAVVYKAKCHLLNRFVAVKILKQELSNDENVVQKFKAEATSVANINGPNIVNIYDVGTENNINYIVMELVEGKTLKEIIKEKGKLTSEEALNIAIQIGKALECAHGRNIIHRDIKPHNILVTKDGIVKVADFGIAKAADQSTITNTEKVLGSAHYFSPEQAKGNIVDCRTDIYSLGIVIYEMVTGKVPYDAENVVSVALKHVQEEVVPPRNLNRNISKGLNNLILKSLEKEPIKRYQSIKEMLVDLKKVRNNSSYNIENIDVDKDITRVMEPVSVNVNEDMNEDKNKKNENKVLKKKIMIGALIAIMTLIIGGLVGWGYNMLVGGNGSLKNQVKVPDIIGKTKEEAEGVLGEYGLQLVVSTKEESDYPKNTIIAVFPKQETLVEKGREIRVTISEGPAKIRVRDFSEWDITQVREVVKNEGLKVGEIEEVFSEVVAKGEIIKQEPKPGTMVEKNSYIKFTVSKGSKDALVPTPNLKDLTLKEAQAVLEAFGLKIGKTTEIMTDKKELDNKIVSQNIEAGTEIKEGTEINISYYKYDELEVQRIVVPNFISLTVLEAKIEAERAGVKISVTGKDDEKVTSQDKEPGSKIYLGEIVNLKTNNEDE